MRKIYKLEENLFKYKPNYLDILLINKNLIKIMISSTLIEKYMKMKNEVTRISIKNIKNEIELNK